MLCPWEADQNGQSPGGNTMIFRLVVLASTAAAATCEVREPQLGPGGFSADSIKVSHDSVNVDCLIGTFRNDDHLHFIIDQDCDGAADYIKRSDGVLYQVRPIRNGKGAVDHSMIMEESSDEFSNTTPARWREEHGLTRLEPGDRFTRPVRIHLLSTSDDRADVGIGMTSDMHVPCFHTHALQYRWVWMEDPDSDRDCWSIRIRGNLRSVVHWLHEAGVRTVRFGEDDRNQMLRWNDGAGVIEVLRNGVIIDRIRI
ncbi:MAG TPA: hypothetical protein DEO57_06175 [Phycisphaerales bacterium]|nr:hypothetical protein [Phycisphaerales bacterium]